MEQSKINLFIMANRDYFSAQQLFVIKDSLANMSDDIVTELMTVKYKNPTSMFFLSFFLGDLGVDKFALGKVWIGILKLITFGGAGIWTFIDLFLIRRKTYNYNFRLFNDMMMYDSVVVNNSNKGNNNNTRRNKIDLFVRNRRKYFTTNQLSEIIDKLEYLPDNKFQLLYTLPFRNPIGMIFVSFFLGYFGVDMFLIRKIKEGIIKVIISIALIHPIIKLYNSVTIYVIILVVLSPFIIKDWFLIYSKTIKYNYRLISDFIDRETGVRY